MHISWQGLGSGTQDRRASHRCFYVNNTFALLKFGVRWYAIWSCGFPRISTLHAYAICWRFYGICLKILAFTARINRQHIKCQCSVRAHCMSRNTRHVLHAGGEPTSTCAVQGVTHILVSMTRVSQNHHKINQHIKGQSTWPDLANRLAWPTSRPIPSKNVRINDLA